MSEFLEPEASETTGTRNALLEKQDVLDLEMSPVDSTMANYEIDMCNTRLEMNGDSVPHLIATVGKEALEAMADIALSLKPKDQNFVVGLKFHLAATDGGEMKLLYQPTYMTRPANGLMEPFYRVTEGYFYSYDDSTGTFESMSAGDAETLKDNYQTLIRIKHRTDTVCMPFIQGVDTESVLFPFQTIFELMADNEGDGIYIHNSIREEPIGGSYIIKHCLLLSSVLLSGNSFTGKYANRSHLCPPSCNEVQYGLV